MTVRIGLVSEHASPLALLGGVDSGGQNVYVGQVAKHLAALGYQVDVLTRRDDPDLPEIVDWAPGARVVHIPAGPATFVRKEELLPAMDAFTLGVLRFMRAQDLRYDLLHANFWMSGLVALNVQEVTGIPFVVTFHALGRVRRRHQKGADQFPNERFAVEDRVVAAADTIIAECPQDRQDLIDLYQADPARITVIPAGFDPDEFWPMDKLEARRVVDLPQDEQIILQLGRMVPRKGVANVIRGFARLVHGNGTGRPLRLVIVGGEADEPDPALTPEIGRLQQVAAEEGVLDRVTFTGRRRRDVLRYYYNAADVFVTTPWYEPFGITPLEAMACARPVVGANVGGIKYTVREGKTGFLVPPHDPDALARRLHLLLESPDLLTRLGREARRRAARLFTWKTVARALAATYADVLSPVLRSSQADELVVVDAGFRDALETTRKAWPAVRASVVAVARHMVETMSAGGKVLICGNGGSAADAQHLTAELVGRFVATGRRALPALTLGTNTAVLTAWSNDVSYQDAFAREIQALGRPGDLLLGLSTSGRSRNVVRAFQAARARGLMCVAFLGGDGGELLALADEAVLVPSANTQRIQEIHTLALHLVCELVEAALLRDNGPDLDNEHDEGILLQAGYPRPLSVALTDEWLPVRGEEQESLHG